MTRPREFIKEEVLEAATELFWEKGFEGTSMNELVEQTGLNKHSMYREFGGKEGLFLACLNFYVHQSNSAINTILTEEPLGLHNIHTFFNNRIEHASRKDCKGCLLMNTVTEKEVVSHTINEVVRTNLSKLKACFYNCLKAAQERGEIRAEQDCHTLAEYLDCFCRGLMNIGKHPIEKKRLRLMTEVALSTITK